MAEASLTAARLRELLHYDPETGAFAWCQSLGRRGHASPGKIAGCVDSRGYRLIRLDGVLYRAHRLAWLYVTGHWPIHGLDHLHGDKDDNRFSMLRECPQVINVQNRRAAEKNSKSGLIGATWVSSMGKWKAQIGSKFLPKKNNHIGYYDTPEEAHAAYLEAKRRLHEGCTI